MIKEKCESINKILLVVMIIIVGIIVINLPGTIFASTLPVSGKILIDNTHMTPYWHVSDYINKLKVYLETEGYLVNYHNVGPITSAVLDDYDVLVLFYPTHYTPLTSSEVDAIVNWVEAGNGLWLGTSYLNFHGTADEANKIASKWGVENKSDSYTETVTNLVAHPIITGVKQFGVYMASSLSGGTPIAYYSDGKPSMIVVEPGNGKAVFIGDSFGCEGVETGSGPFDDAHIDLLDNKQLALNTVAWLMMIPGIPGRIFPDKAVELAKEVIEAPYHREIGEPSTKGFIWEKNKGFYFFTPEQVKSGYPEKKPGLDCSGLSFWSYNRAYYSNGYETDRENFPLRWEGPNGQYKYNADKIKKDELKPGDLLFFDEYPVGDNIIDHVAMYIGGLFEFKYKKDGEDKVFTYNSIEATAWGDEIIGVAFYDVDKEILTTLQPSTGKIRTLTVDGYGRVKDAKVPEFKAIAKSPVDLVIIDPDGEIITKEKVQSPTMEYEVYDVDGDGKLDDIVIGGERKLGNYLIQIVPEPDALPTDTYSLEVTANGQTIVFAENVPISDIPRIPYILRSTETEIIPIIPAFVDFDPDTLNLKSKGQWVTVYLELPAGYNVNEIDLESIKLNGQILIEQKPIEISDYNSNGIPDLMVKFNLSAVKNVLEVGDKVEIKITGELINGKQFEGSDIIRVIK